MSIQERQEIWNKLRHKFEDMSDEEKINELEYLLGHDKYVELMEEFIYDGLSQRFRMYFECMGFKEFGRSEDGKDFRKISEIYADKMIGE